MKKLILMLLAFLIISGCEDMKMDKKVESNIILAL